MINLIFALVALVLLAFLQANEVAFVSSGIYREESKQTHSYLGNIIHGFYRQTGLFLFTLRTWSVIYIILGLFFLDRWLNPFYPWDESFATSLIVKVVCAFLLFYVAGVAIPRMSAARCSDSVLCISAFPLNLLNFVQQPIGKMLLWLPLTFLKQNKPQTDDQFVMHLCGIHNIGDETMSRANLLSSSSLKESDMKIFRNTLEFSNIHVRDCIVPRTEIIAVEHDASISELTAAFTRSGKTRILVYKEDLDHVLGYVHSSELFRANLREDWRDSIAEIPVVPESMSAQKMMHIFLQQKKPLALVVDEFGGTTGIISLEDLVEEIFGDIEDEHDNTNYTARRLTENEYLLSARLEVEKINELFNLDLPLSDEYITLGGLILFYHEEIPKENQEVNIGKFNFHVVKASRAQIHLVKLKVMSLEKK